MKEKFLIKFSDKSFFRMTDRAELFILYVFCFFLNIVFELGTKLKVSSHILMMFIKEFTDYKVQISLLFTIIVAIFHYQLRNRKKMEIYCRILVGDILSKIIIRYICECLVILVSAYFISIIIKLYFSLDLYGGTYLVGTFIMYILFSAIKVVGYENL